MMNTAASTVAFPSKTAAGHFVQVNQFDDVDVKMRLVMRICVNPGVNAKYETENVKFLV